MNNKKTTRRALFSSIMALLLCCSMLVGTTFAWFTDSVTSAGNIIKSGTLEVEMYWADGTKAVPATDSTEWKDASKGPIFDYDLWEPGYTEVRHVRIANVGTLALKYQLQIDATGIVSKLAEVIDVYFMDPAEQIQGRTNLDEANKVGTLKQILTGGITNARGDLKKGEDVELTIALKMQEDAGNEYQNLSIGSNFAVKLFATQMEAEIDSFGSDYDKESNYPNVPIANVTQLRELNVKALMNSTSVSNSQPLTLSSGYQFTPTETYDEVDVSDYKYWQADFVVSADQDIPGGSVALAGYYDAFCQFIDDNWVALSSPDPITAGTEIALIETMGAQVHYKDIGQYGNDGVGFCCGIAGMPGYEDALAGTTINVELRLYETEEDDYAKKVDPENYVVIGSYSYTFPATAVNSQEELTDVLAAGASAVELGAGEYKMPSSTSNGTLKITGTKDAVVDVTLGAYLDSATVSFEGVTIKTGTGKANGNGSDYAALYSPNVTYTNCTFVGPMRVGRDGAKFINCTFTELGNDYVWTYGNDVTFEGCTFNTDGKAILIYSDGGNEVSEVSVTDCTFNATAGAKAGAIANQNCAAIEIHNYGNGVDLTTSGNTYDSNFSGEWRIKDYVAGRPGITVNGAAYTTIALDGKTMTIDGDKNVTVNG